jgi:hypothetical protein
MTIKFAPILNYIKFHIFWKISAAKGSTKSKKCFHNHTQNQWFLSKSRIEQHWFEPTTKSNYEMFNEVPKK